MTTRWLTAALLLCACDAGPDEPGTVYMPEMFESVPYDAHDENEVLPNGMTLQPPPEGTIPRGHTPLHYEAGPEEAALAGEELENPLAATEDELARGREQYDTFCAVCHGGQGDGDGSVVPPFPNPPSLKANHAIDMPDGQLFHVISHGQGFMPSYAVQVRPEDRWRIVLYLRELQGVEPAGPAEGADTTASEAEGVDGEATDLEGVDAEAATDPAADDEAATDPAADDEVATDPAADDEVADDEAATDVAEPAGTADPSAEPEGASRPGPAPREAPTVQPLARPAAADAGSTPPTTPEEPDAPAAGGSDGD